MTYGTQGSIDGAIDNLITQIAKVWPAHMLGRIEVKRESCLQVIEFETTDEGRWRETRWHTEKRQEDRQ